MDTPTSIRSVIEERANRLADLCRGLPVTRAFPLLAEIALPVDLLAMLRRATARYLRASLACYRPDRRPATTAHFLQELRDDLLQLPNRTPNGKLAAKQEVAEEFNLVQQAVELVFRQLGISSHVEAIQLPMNVRLVDGRPDVAVESRPYATSKMHSDIWTGEAADSVTVIIPVLGDIENTGLEFFEPAFERVEDFVKTFSDYLDTQVFCADGNRYRLAMNASSLYAFDSFLLHQTVKRNGGVRVSIDFRFLYKHKLASDIQRDASRAPHYVPESEWYTLERGTFLHPTGTFAEAVRKYAGTALSRGGPTGESEFSVIPWETR